MAGMVIERDVPVPAEDGVVLRADVFRPSGPGRYPVLLSYGPYAKGLAFQDGYADQWQLMVSQHPEVARGSSGAQQNWEVVDPEKWVPDGYACVRVDSRGAGRSPGVLEPFSPRETRDLYECIEWAAGQPWSTGKIGLTGISYYAMNQWHVAALGRRTWPPSASGKGPPTSTAMPPITAASCARSGRTGTTSRSPWSSTGWASAGRAAG